MAWPGTITLGVDTSLDLEDKETTIKLSVTYLHVQLMGSGFHQVLCKKIYPYPVCMYVICMYVGR